MFRFACASLEIEWCLYIEYILQITVKWTMATPPTFTLNITFFFLFKNCGLNYPQCKLATKWHHWRQFVRCSFPLKASYFSFHICSSPPQDLLTTFNGKLVKLPFNSLSNKTFSLCLRYSKCSSCTESSTVTKVSSALQRSVFFCTWTNLNIWLVIKIYFSFFLKEEPSLNS